MRIAVSQAALGEGRITRIAKKLRKALRPRSLSLMQSLDALALLLGYRTLHELQLLASPAEVPPVDSLTVVKAATWKLYRAFGLEFGTASQIAASLPWDELNPPKQKMLAYSGNRFIVMDEAWNLLQEPWHASTPMLLAGGAPPYRHVIYPDRRVFSWSRLTLLYEMLPDGWEAELRAEPSFVECQSDTEIKTRFISMVLVPQAFLSLTTAVSERAVDLNGFTILAIYDKDGQSLGYVISQSGVRGVIPRVYGSPKGEIDEAVADLLCGIPIASDSQPLIEQGDIALYRTYVESVGTSELVSPPLPLSDNIRYTQENGRVILHGASFVADGQTYLRRQPLVTASDIPPLLAERMTGFETRLESDPYYRAADAAIPSIANELSANTQELIYTLWYESQSALRVEATIARLMDVVVAVDSTRLDAIQMAEFEDEFKILSEPGSVDSEMEAERAEQLDRTKWLGGYLKTMFPALIGFEDMTLVGVLHRVQMGFNGIERHSLSPPEHADDDDALQFLAGLWRCLIEANQGDRLRGEFKPKETMIAVSAALAGEIDASEIPATSSEIGELRYRLEVQSRDSDRANKWLVEAANRRNLREQGEYLWLGESVPAERPENAIEGMYRRLRKFGSREHAVVQRQTG